MLNHLHGFPEQCQKAWERRGAKGDVYAHNVVLETRVLSSWSNTSDSPHWQGFTKAAPIL